jgi:hypothetical protein
MTTPAMSPVDAHPPHRWQCPVIMKTALGCVAYTCARCGAIGVVGGHEPLSQLRTWSAASSERGVAPLRCIPRDDLATAEPTAPRRRFAVE